MLYAIFPVWTDHTWGRSIMSLNDQLGAKAPAKIQEVTLMRPIHGNL